jgi:hypothetical protein
LRLVAFFATVITSHLATLVRGPRRLVIIRLAVARLLRRAVLAAVLLLRTAGVTATSLISDGTVLLARPLGVLKPASHSDEFFPINRNVSL